MSPWRTRTPERGLDSFLLRPSRNSEGMDSETKKMNLACFIEYGLVIGPVGRCYEACNRSNRLKRILKNILAQLRYLLLDDDGHDVALLHGLVSLPRRNTVNNLGQC